MIWWKPIIDRPPSKNRALNMKLRFQRHHHDKKGGGGVSWCRLCKWPILLTCLSFYFLMPYVLRFDPRIHTSNTHVLNSESSSRSSRALLQPLQESKIRRGLSYRTSDGICRVRFLIFFLLEGVSCFRLVDEGFEGLRVRPADEIQR